MSTKHKKPTELFKNDQYIVIKLLSYLTTIFTI